MNESPEQFEQLRKLLKLKSYEQPPPGYYDHLASRVMSRLEADGAAANASWLTKLQRVLVANPISAGILGGCAALMVVIANFATGQASDLPLGIAVNGGDGSGDGSGGLKVASFDASAGGPTIAVGPMLPAASFSNLTESPFSFPSARATTVSLISNP